VGRESWEIEVLRNGYALKEGRGKQVSRYFLSVAVSLASPVEVA
jgi:hypothetical protein